MYRIFLVLVSVLGISTGSAFVAFGGYVDAPEDVERVSKFMRQRVQAHIDFLEDTQEMLKSLTEGRVEFAQGYDQITRNIVSLRGLSIIIEEFTSLKARSDYLCANLLESRLRTLSNRNNLRQKAAQNQMFVHPSTYQELKADLSPAEQMVATMATDLHDMYMDCILEVFPLLQLTEINSKARHALMMSPSLWELLKMRLTPERDLVGDFLFPNQGMLNIPGEGVLIFERREESPKKSLTLHPDLVLDHYADVGIAQDHLVITSTEEVPHWAGLHKFTRWIERTNFESQQIAIRSGKKVDAPIPPLDPFSVFLEFMGVSIPEPQKKITISSMSIASSALQTTQVTPIDHKELNLSHEFRGVDDAVPAAAAVLDGAEQAFLAILPPHTDRSIASNVLEKPLSAISESPYSEELPSQELALSPVLLQKMKKKSRVDEAFALAVSPEEEVHPRDVTEGEAKEKFIFSPRQKKLINKIFGIGGKFVPIQFDDFVKLWTSAPISGYVVPRSSGGSHHSIVFQNQVVGKTFAPHKAGQGVPSYGKRTVQAIRSALTAIGVLPE